MVDKADFDDPVVDGGRHRPVVLEDLRVVRGDAGEPGIGNSLALDHAVGGDERLEARFVRRDFDAAGPLGLGEGSHGGGHLVGGQLRAVVDDHPGAASDANPAGVGGGEAGRHGLRDVVRQVREQVGVAQCAERTGILGQEDLGGRLFALFQQQGAEFGRVALTHVDGDLGLGLELVDQRLNELLVAA